MTDWCDAGTPPGQRTTTTTTASFSSVTFNATVEYYSDRSSSPVNDTAHGRDKSSRAQPIPDSPTDLQRRLDEAVRKENKYQKRYDRIQKKISLIRELNKCKETMTRIQKELDRLGELVATEIECERAAEIERERAAEIERERAAEIERERAAEIERERAAEIERERAAEIERERAAEIERKRAAEIKRERAAEIERERAAENSYTSPGSRSPGHDARLQEMTGRTPEIVPEQYDPYEDRSYDLKNELAYRYSETHENDAQMEIADCEYQDLRRALHEADREEYYDVISRGIPDSLIRVLKAENMTVADKTVFHDVVIPDELIPTFLRIVWDQSLIQQPSCGVLLGYAISSIGVIVVNQLLIPYQSIYNEKSGIEVCKEDKCYKKQFEAIELKKRIFPIGRIYAKPNDLYPEMNTPDLQSQFETQVEHKDAISIVCSNLLEEDENMCLRLRKSPVIRIYTLTEGGFVRLHGSIPTKNFHYLTDYKIAYNFIFHPTEPFQVYDARGPLVAPLCEAPTMTSVTRSRRFDN